MKSKLDAYKNKQRGYTTGTDKALEKADKMIAAKGRAGVAKVLAYASSSFKRTMRPTDQYKLISTFSGV